MASIKLENITKTYKNVKALDDVSIQIEDGEFFCILGPPGAGKTTLLRIIVGLEKPDHGNVYIGDEIVNDLHPSKRDIAMIFQNLALYPDKSIFDNIAFPLRQQKMDEEIIKEKVTEIAKQLKIDWMLDKLPSQLSGGERQRVAIGRAIVREPKAYLMDEPLSNLDALLRLEMRVSLKELQTKLSETFVYVTHDQVEALSMGDRIAILNKGRIQQIDDPERIYKLPKNMFVATVLGSPPMNFLKCRVEVTGGEYRIIHEGFILSVKDKNAIEVIGKMIGNEEGLVLGIRPEDILLHNFGGKERIEAEIYVTEPLGNETIVDVKIASNVIKVLADSSFEGRPGQKIWIEPKKYKFHFFNKKTGDSIFHTTKETELEIL